MQATVDGMALIRELDAAQKRLQSARREVIGAEREVSNAESALVKWLIPKDAKVGDVFCLAIGEAFLEVRVAEKHGYQEHGGKVSLGLDYVVGWRNGVAPRKGL